MVTLTSLWLPILLASVGVFFASFLMWMVLPHHKSDWKAVPDEDSVMDALRTQGAKPGQYMFPHCGDRAQMKDPEFMKKYEEGPAGILILKAPGGFNMGKSMVQSLVFNIVISVIVAYVATIALTTTSSAMDIFRLTATVGFLGYAGALGWGLIWWQRSGETIFKEVVDGLVYGCVLGAVFLWMWPAA